MDTSDISLYETGNGGDFAILNEDLQMGESLYRNIYLALFGGNIEASTKKDYLDFEERFDYWGNKLIWGTQKESQFNSETERLLNTISLNSAGRVAVIQSVNIDLEYLKEVVNFTVDVKILSVSRIAIIIDLKEKSNQEDKVLQLIFDNIKKEVIIDKII